MKRTLLLGALLALVAAGCDQDNGNPCDGGELLTGQEACEENDEALRDRFDECCPDSAYDVDEECDEEDDSGEPGCIEAEDVDDCNDDIAEMDCPQDCDDVSDDGDGWHNATLPGSCFYLYAD